MLEPRVLLRALDDVAIHLLDAILLLMTRLVPSRLVGLLFERKQAEDVHVFVRQVTIPGPGAASVTRRPAVDDRARSCGVPS